MHAKDFNKLVDDRIEDMKKSLQAKAEDYASAADRLYNFKRAAAVREKTPEEILWGYVTKHLIWIQDYVEGIEAAHQQSEDYIPKAGSRETLRERCGDARNYLILLEALAADTGRVV
jgi:hypothetical protein